MTLEEQLELQARRGLLGLGIEQETAEEYAPWASLLAQFLPGVGEGVGVDNTVNAINDERYGDAAIEGGLTLLGAVPVVGDMAAAAIKGIRKAPVPKRSRKKAADMTPEEHEAHKAWRRERHKARQDERNPNRRVKQDVKNMSPEEREVWNQGRLEKKREQESRRVLGMSDEEIASKRAREKEWREANRERLLSTKKRYREENPERVRAGLKSAYEANKPAYIARGAARRAAQLQRTPAWADPEKVKEIYRTAAEVSAETGIPHHVDHVMPLQGRNVSGLHHQDNLLIVPGAENLSKHNKFEPGDLPPRAGVRKSRAYLKKIREAKEKAKR